MDEEERRVRDNAPTYSFGCCPSKPKLTAIQSRTWKSEKKKMASPPSRIDSPKRAYQRSKIEGE
jgi:hypothetical protein